MIDLQIHSNYSDGFYSPDQIVHLAQKLGFKAIAITDHDSIAGLSEALKASNKYNIEVIPALELSCEFLGKNIHLLGYFIDHRNKQLVAALKKIQVNRIERIKQLIKQINLTLPKGEQPLAWPEVHRYAKGVPGRPHLAQVILDKGLAQERQVAFNKYLSGKLDRSYFLPLEKAIALIHQAGGLAVLSHPLERHTSLASFSQSQTGQKAVLKKLVRHGLDGLEVYHPAHANSGKIRILKQWAKELSLCMTAGTDAHGPWLGYTDIKPTKYPYKILEDLKDFYSKKYK